MRLRPFMARLLAGERHKPLTEAQVNYTLYRPRGRVDVIRREGEWDIYKGRRS